MSKKISKTKAKKWVSKFKNEGGKGSKSAMFSKADVLAILGQPNCEGLRVYNGFDEESTASDKFTMFLVGTTADGTNLLPTSDTSTTEQYFIQDDAVPCPPNCPGNDL